MKTLRIRIITVILMVAIGLLFYADVRAQVKPVSSTVSRSGSFSSVSTSRASRGEIIKKVDFKLKDEKTVIFGRLISDDKNKATIEQFVDGHLQLRTYSKDDMEPRSYRIKALPEAKYAIEMAEFFTSLTNDFDNDPDDFISAIRWYEKAKRSLSLNMNLNKTRIEDIDEKIAELKADREVWKREAQDRKQLKSLELEATLETRIRSLQSQINSNSTHIKNIEDQSKSDDASTITVKSLEARVQQMDTAVARQLQMIEDRLSRNERDIQQYIRLDFNNRPRVYYRR